MTKVEILLSPMSPATWEERNTNELRSFVAGETGSKLIAHYRAIMQGLLNEAMNETDPQVALSRLNIAKGFALALASIDLSVVNQPATQVDELDEAEQKTNAQFAKIIGRPAIFK